MAPMAAKRRRVEDEVRPKKKAKKNIRKGKAYHSSSEDDDDEPTTNGTQRASDAPRPQPKHSMKASIPMTKPTAAKKVQASKPKSILKQAKPAPVAADASSSEAEADVDELEKNTALNALQADDAVSDDDLDENDEPDLDSAASDDDEDDEESLASESEASVTSSQAARAKKKRNDPTAFASSISKILETNLSKAKRQDPVLSRSKSAAEANKTLADEKLEQKVRAQIRAEKRQASEKGRVKDVLGLETPDVDTGAIVEEEKKLKKTAQRGVVKLFNAVRAAQVKAEEAMKQARSEGMVGMQKREEKVNEMSKQGFLDLISSGGKQSAALSS